MALTQQEKIQTMEDIPVGHGRKWLDRADELSKKWDVPIRPIASLERSRKADNIMPHKYTITCKHCGYTRYAETARKNLVAFLKHPEKFTKDSYVKCPHCHSKNSYELKQNY